MNRPSSRLGGPAYRRGAATAHGRAAGVRVGLAAVVGCAVLVGCAAGPPTGPAPAAPTPPTSATGTGPSVGPSSDASAGPSVPPSVAVSGAPDTRVTAPTAGTGPAADRMAAETAFRTYLRAVADGDFATACSLNAPETTRRLLDELARRGTPATACEQAVATLYAGSGVAQGAAAIADTLSVQRVDVTGDAATVTWSVQVSGRRPVVTNGLRRIDGRWRLLPTPGPAG